MAVSHGMDVGEVRRLGGSLQASAGEIDDLVRRIEGVVSGSSWVGTDAQMFKTQWWPARRARLKQMSEDLYGLGQSAINNASDQEQASGDTGGSSASSSAAGISADRAAELRAEAESLESPQAVNDWWNSLTENERDTLIESDPGLIGNLDGISPEDRYKANRLSIAAYVDELRAERAELADDFTLLGPGLLVGDNLARWRADMAALDAKISTFEDLGSGDNNILLFDSSGDGRVAQVFGDLSTASKVAIVVPGVGNDLDNFSSENAWNLYEASGGADGDTATIQWLGYDTPDSATSGAAKDPAMAQEQAGNLVSFVNGLGTNSDAEVSVVAHSYGTVYAAEAAKAGMVVDKVVLVGSPGISAPNASVFNGANVYAIGNEGDPVLAENPLAIGTNHGTDPLTSDFGATVLPGNDFEVKMLNPLGESNHSTYFDVDSQSLDSITSAIEAPYAPNPSFELDDGTFQSVRIEDGVVIETNTASY